MAVSAGTAWLQIRPETSQLSKGIGSAVQSAGGAISGFGSTLTRTVSAPIIAATGLAGAFGIKSAVSFEQAQTAFSNLLPVGADVTGFMKQLSDFAAESPFDVTSINNAATGLLGVGVAAGDVLPLLAGMGDAVAGFGGSAADVEMVNYAMKQVIGSGRAYTQDINQIATYVPTIWQEVAAQMGVSVDEARTMASEGKITSDVLVKAFEEPIGPLQNLAGSMEAQAGTLQGVWSTFTDTVGAQLTQAILPLLPQIKTAIGDLGAAIGPALQAAVPAFIDLGNAMVPLIGKVADVLTWFSKLSPEMQKWIVYAVAGAAAAGPLVRVFGGVVSAVGGVAKGVGGLVKAGAAIAGFAGKIGGVLRAFGAIRGVVVLFNILKLTIISGLRAIGLAFLTNPVGLLITAIVLAIAAAAYLIYRYWDQIKAAFAKAWNAIKPILTGIWNAIKSAFEQVKSVFMGVVTAVSGFFTGLWNTIKSIWSGIVSVFTTVVGIIQGVVSGIVGVFQAIIGFVVPIWNTFFAIITLPVRIWWTVVSAIFQLAWAFIQFVFNAIVAFVTPLWNSLWAAVSAVVTTVWGAISAALSAAWNFIVSVFNAIKDGVLAAWNFLWGAVRSAWDSVYGFISSGVSRAKDFVVSAFEQMRDKIRGVWDGIKNIVKGAVDAVVGIASGIWGGLKGVINTGIGLLNSAISGFNKIIGAVNKVPGVSVPTIPTIPRLAEGGIISRPTVAMVGEAGAEAVIPLSKLDAYIGGGKDKERPIYLQVQIGDRDITDMIERTVRRDNDRTALALARGRRL